MPEDVLAWQCCRSLPAEAQMSVIVPLSLARAWPARMDAKEIVNNAVNGRALIGSFPLRYSSPRHRPTAITRRSFQTIWTGAICLKGQYSNATGINSRHRSALRDQRLPEGAVVSQFELRIGSPLRSGY